MSAGVTINVEPDSLSAWIGVAGTGTAVVLRAAIQGIPDMTVSRMQRKRQFTDVGDVLLGSKPVAADRYNYCP